MKFLVNLLATLVLVLLLAAPGVFSVNLVDFEKDVGIAIFNNVGKFGKFLQIRETGNTNLPRFDLEFTTFEDTALYKGIITVENKEEFAKTLQIVNENPDIAIYFDLGGTTAGPAEVMLTPGEKIDISLLVPPISQPKTASFSLILK